MHHSKNIHPENDPKYKGLTVTEGVSGAPSVNPYRSVKASRKKYSPEEYVAGIRAGDIAMLGQAVTLVESSLPEHQLIAQEVITRCLPFAGNSVRIGITGVPGAGKSTFIESFGKIVLDKGLKLAVLAIDPSSNVTGGSILGDKTRMNWLSQQENVFIRPTATGNNLGGVARNTREAIILCEAAGYDVILIETVGVGQSETVVHSMIDFFLLLMLSGAGDELQGIKRGIMEMADAIVITKADGENLLKAKQARSQYANALHLFPAKESQWIATSQICSSLQNEGLNEIWATIESFFNQVTLNGWLLQNRKNQELSVLREHLSFLLQQEFFGKQEWLTALNLKEEAIQQGKITAFKAAEELFEKFKKSPDL
jgi:LAO/AO transport system kinase